MYTSDIQCVDISLLEQEYDHCLYIYYTVVKHFLGNTMKFY